ncbi:MAG: tetratricopeptide repeat protein [Bacteroidetes bacterium]|nr:tetratricopeptide repeat protein [Bacteroidota bacterium]
MTSPRIDQLLEMLKSEPHDSFLNYALALEYAKANDTPKAIEIITTLLHRDETYLGAYYQLGKYYEQINQIEKAISTYTKGASIAKQQKNNKALGELNEALWMLED